MKTHTYINLFFWCLVAIVSGATCSCSKEASSSGSASSPDSIAALVHQLQTCDRLYTSEYVVRKIVTYDDVVRVQGSVFSRKFNFKLPQGDRKILIPMEASIKAYIDFADFEASDIRVTSDSTIHVSLPDPQIVVTATTIDHRGVKSFIDYGRSTFSYSEMAEFEKQGRASIVASIPSMGITEKARLHAYHALLPMFEAMGYRPENVTMDFRKQYSDQDYSDALVVIDTKD